MTVIRHLRNTPLQMLTVPMAIGLSSLVDLYVLLQHFNSQSTHHKVLPSFLARQLCGSPVAIESDVFASLTAYDKSYKYS